VKLATHPGVARFIELAREYRELLAGPRNAGVTVFLAQLHLCLARLYASALELPEVQPDRSEVEWEGKGSLTRSALRADIQGALGAREYYSEMFAPYELQGQAPVIGSLSDDLADIYADVSRGLAAWDAKEFHAAVWEWRFHFGHHWGEHVTGALRALHALRANCDYAEPEFPERAV
jgi:hypothetical protein